MKKGELKLKLHYQNKGWIGIDQNFGGSLVKDSSKLWSVVDFRNDGKGKIKIRKVGGWSGGENDISMENTNLNLIFGDKSGIEVTLTPF